MNAIYVENLVKRYGDKKVLKKVNLKIEEGLERPRSFL